MVLVSGCAAVPSGGPRAITFSNSNAQQVGSPASSEGEDGLPFVLVDVNRKIIEMLMVTEKEGVFKGTFTDRSEPSEVFIGVGDTLRVTIFEAGSGGLFVPTGGTINSGNFVSIPDQEVDRTGSISIPYAEKDGDGGLIKVSGKRPLEVQSEIQQRLMNRAIEPQVIVTLVKRTSNLYSVIGDVGEPGRFSLTPGGIRVLDALGQAGGPKGADYNTLITLQRGNSSATVRLSTLLTDPENNVYVQAGDVVAVKKEERYYNVLGAARSNSRVAFDTEKLSVGDAIAKAGGLNDSTAEPSAVVVMRRENAKTLETMGVKVENFKDAEPIPTVYRFNLKEPAGLFLAQKMQMRNDDVLYISEHPFNDISKLMNVLRDILLIKVIEN